MNICQTRFRLHAVQARRDTALAERMRLLEVRRKAEQGAEEAAKREADAAAERARTVPYAGKTGKGAGKGGKASFHPCSVCEAWRPGAGSSHPVEKCRYRTSSPSAEYGTTPPPFTDVRTSGHSLGDASAFVAYVREPLASAAPALLARAQEARALDSGASRHIPDLRKETAVGGTKSIDPLALQTIMGPVTMSESTEITIPMIGQKPHLHVDNTPSVLSLGQLVMDDHYEVRWKAEAVGGRGFELFAPTGERVPTRIEDYVPVLDEPGAAHVARIRGLPHEEAFLLVAALVQSLSDEQLTPLVAAFFQGQPLRGCAARHTDDAPEEEEAPPLQEELSVMTPSVPVPLPVSLDTILRELRCRGHNLAHGLRIYEVSTGRMAFVPSGLTPPARSPSEIVAEIDSAARAAGVNPEELRVDLPGSASSSSDGSRPPEDKAEEERRARDTLREQLASFAASATELVDGPAESREEESEEFGDIPHWRCPTEGCAFTIAGADPCGNVTVPRHAMLCGGPEAHGGYAPEKLAKLPVHECARPNGSVSYTHLTLPTTPYV